MWTETGIPPVVNGRLLLTMGPPHRVATHTLTPAHIHSRVRRAKNLLRAMNYSANTHIHTFTHSMWYAEMKRLLYTISVAKLSGQSYYESHLLTRSPCSSRRIGEPRSAATPLLLYCLSDWQAPPAHCNQELDYRIWLLPHIIALSSRFLLFVAHLYK